MNQKTAVILVNVGTPESFRKKDVRKYLTEFLNDPRVIDIPWILRKLLVNLVIVPFRTGKSSGLYRRLWTTKGSPLLIHMENLIQKLEAKETGGYRFFGAMRYGKPSLDEVLNGLEASTTDKIIIVPLYPQYASSTTGSVIEKSLKALRNREVMPGIRLISQFYDDEAFVNAFVSKIQRYRPSTYDHILFSYHGLPDRQIRKVHPGEDMHRCRCDEGMTRHGKYCYKAACYETTRLLAGKLGLPGDAYSVSFQSRLSKDWLSPFTDDRINELASRGIRRLLVVAPSFVADCLETIVEIGEDYRDLFIRQGGEELTLVESLNDDDEWVDALFSIVSDPTR